MIPTVRPGPTERTFCFAPGPGIAVIGPSSLLFLPEPTDDPLTRQLLALAESKPDDLHLQAAALFAEHSVDMPPFGLVVFATDRLTVCLCGGVVGRGTWGAQTVFFDGRVHKAWNQQEIPDATATFSFGTLPDTPVFRVRGVGVVPCAGITITCAPIGPLCLADLHAFGAGIYSELTTVNHQDPVDGPPEKEGHVFGQNEPSGEADTTDSTERPGVAPTKILEANEQHHGPGRIADFFARPSKPQPPRPSASAPADFSARGGDGKDHDGNSDRSTEPPRGGGPFDRSARGVNTPLVPGRVCPSQHFNDPDARNCRTCGAGIVGDAPIVSRPRPCLGRLEFDDHHLVDLDHPLLLGRNPGEGVLVGGEVAGAVRLHDPSGRVSHTHLKIYFAGWQVLVENPGSTNSTEMTDIVGRHTELLSGAAVPLTPGTVVDLAGERSFTYRSP